MRITGRPNSAVDYSDPKKSSARKKSPSKPGPKVPARILSIDLGGTSVKFLSTGETEPRKVSSGPEFTPAQMVEEIRAHAKGWKYDAVSLGYPGLVSKSGPAGEPANLGPGWVGFDFTAAFDRPVRIVNDATLQALGSYDGGRMLFLGFGTGVGSVLIIDDTVVQLELGELRWKLKTFCEHFGRPALEAQGKKRWRERVLSAIPSLQRAFLADYVVVGGGNSKHMLEPLPPNVRIGHNLTAFRGGSRLWGIDELPDREPGDHGRTRSGRSWRLL